MRALVLLSLAACSPILMSESPAPPGRSARLDAVDGFWSIKSYRLELSQGVAIAVSCYRGGPCEKLAVTSDNPAVAEVKPASLGVLVPNGGMLAGNRATTAAFVVVGKQPGQTRVHVRSKDGGRELEVTVVPPPVHGAPSTVAR
jgi:hypothetical protein